MAKRPTFQSLIKKDTLGSGMLLRKLAQDMGGGQPMPPGMSPVTGNPDEMQVPESADTSKYESDFGSIAHQFVMDRAPALAKYMLGFEVVDKNDDGSKAIGIFGYKVGDDYYYAPVFFLNNQVKGVDLLLNKKTNQFVPLTDEWIDYIVNRHSIDMGGQADGRVREHTRQPNLNFLRIPAIAGAKTASAEDNSPWSFAEAWDHVQENISKLASDSQASDVISGLYRSAHRRNRMEAGLAPDADLPKQAEAGDIREFLTKRGGPEAFGSLMKTFIGSEKFAEAAMTFYKDLGAFDPGTSMSKAAYHVEKLRKKAEDEPKVRVISSPDVDVDGNTSSSGEGGDPTDTTNIGEEDAQRILAHGFTIQDERPDNEVSQLSNDSAKVQYEKTFNPVTGPGCYDFFMSDGKFRRGYGLRFVAGEMGFGVLFPDAIDGKAVLCENPNEYLAQTSEGGESLMDFYNACEDISMVDVDNGSGEKKRYVFLDSKGNAVGPFNVEAVLKDGDDMRIAVCYEGFVTLKTPKVTSGRGDAWDFDGRGDPAFDGYRFNCCDPCEPNTGIYNVKCITLNGPDGKVRKSGCDLTIPSGWKCIAITSAERSEVLGGASDAEWRKNRAKADKEAGELRLKYTFATPDDLINKLEKSGTVRVAVKTDGMDRFTLRVDDNHPVEGLSYKQASVMLVTRFGFRPASAFGFLDNVEKDGSDRCLVRFPERDVEKKAQMADIANQTVGAAMPYPTEQVPAADPYSGVPIYQSPYIELVPGESTGIPEIPPEGGTEYGINLGSETERQQAAGGAEGLVGEHDGFGDPNDPFGGQMPIDQEAQNLADQAAQAGQKHVFDQAAIGGLARVYDTANVVDSYIPDFMDTLDRLGRTLFLFYWKHEDFTQRYGVDDVASMEDLLRNVFKQLGRLTLQLKEKAVQED